MLDRSFEETQAIRADIAQRYNLVFPDVILEPLWWGRRPVNRATGRYAIVDQNNDTLYNVCTDIYQPVFHEEIIKLVEDVVGSLKEFGTPEINVSLLSNGGKLKINVHFPEVQYEIRVGDIVNPTMDIFSSYDLGWKYGGLFGAYRIICSNGAKVGKVFESFKKRHLISLDPTELSDTMLIGMGKFSEQTDLWKKWADQKIMPKLYEEMWHELPFSKHERERIELLPEAQTGILLPTALKSKELTRWDFFNVVTQFTSHEIKSELRRVDIEPEITRVFEKFEK